MSDPSNNPANMDITEQPTSGVFDFATAEDDLYEVEVNDDLPIDDDDDSTVFSEMEESVGDDDGIDNGPDMAHAVMVNHSDCVYVSAIHPTKPELCITGGGDDRAFLWTYDTFLNTPLSTESRIMSSIELSGHSDTISSVGFNFDGTMALTSSYDGTIRTWDVTTGLLKLVIDGPEDIEWAQWHSKGNAIVAGSNDGTIWMWLAHDGQCVQVFAGHDGGVSSGCFTSDGKFICSGGDDGTVRMWAPKTGQCKHVFDQQTGHSGLVTCIASSKAEPDLLLTGKFMFIVNLVLYFTLLCYTILYIILL